MSKASEIIKNITDAAAAVNKFTSDYSELYAEIAKVNGVMADSIKITKDAVGKGKEQTATIKLVTDAFEEVNLKIKVTNVGMQVLSTSVTQHLDKWRKANDALVENSKKTYDTIIRDRKGLSDSLNKALDSDIAYFERVNDAHATSRLSLKNRLDKINKDIRISNEQAFASADRAHTGGTLSIKGGVSQPQTASLSQAVKNFEDSERAQLREREKTRNSLDVIQARINADRLAREKQLQQALMTFKKADEKYELSRAKAYAAAQAAKEKADRQAATAARQAAAEQARRAREGIGHIKENITNVQELGLSWKAVLRLMASRAFSVIFYRMAGEISAGVQRAQELGIAIAEIQTITLRTKQTTEEWMNDMIQLSNLFGIDTADQVAATYEAISNQIVTGANAMKFMEEENKLAVVTQTSVKKAVDLTSSALNAYGYSADQANEINAKLFKTIEVGRVRSEEMADSFGGLAILGNQVGVSIDELLASVSTLTIQGIKYDHVATQMRGLMSDLIKPTKEMKTLIKSLGYESGEAAVKGLGWSGVLKALNDKTKGSSTELAKYVDRMYGLIGAMGEMGPKYQMHLSALNKITEAQDDYNAAVDLMTKDKYVMYQKQMQEVRNEFTRMGDSILSTIQVFGGVKNAFDTLAIAATSGATAWLTYKIALQATELMMVRTVGTAARLQFQIAATAGAAAAALVVIETLTYLANKETEALNKVEAARKASYERQEAIARDLINETNKLFEEQVRRQTAILAESKGALFVIEEEINEAIKARAKTNDKEIKDTQKLIALNKESLDWTEARIKLLEKYAKIAGAPTIRELNSSLSSALGVKASQETLILAEEHLKVIQETRDIAEEFYADVVEASKERLSLAEQTKVVEDDIIKTNAEMLAATRKGEYKLAKQKWDALERYYKKQEELEQKHWDLVDKFNASERGKQLTANKASLDQQFRDAQDKLAAIKRGEKGTNVIDGVTYTGDSAYKIQQKKLKEIEEARAKAQAKKDEALKKEEAFTSGMTEHQLRAWERLNEEIKGSDAFYEREQAAKRLEEESAKLRKATEAAKTGKIEKEQLDNQKKAWKKAYDEKVKLDKEIESQQAAAKDKVMEKGTKADISEEMKAKLDQQKIEGDAYFAATKALEEKVTNMARTEYAIRLHDLELFEIEKKRLAGILTDKQAAAEVMKSDASLIERAKAAGIDTTLYQGAVAQDAELQEKAKNVKQKQMDPSEYQKAIKESAGVVAGLLQGPVSDYVRGLVEKHTGDQTAFTADEVTAAKKEIDSAKGLSDKQKEIMQRNLDALITEAAEQEKARKAYEEGSKASTDAARENTTALSDLNLTMQQIVEAMRGGLAPVTKASGGMIHGSDTVPALLSAGEFVVNKQGTKDFYSQLVGINSGRGASAGGNNTNIYGDFNITPVSSGLAKLDAVAIGRTLRRLVKNGQVSL